MNMTFNILVSQHLAENFMIELVVEVDVLHMNIFFYTVSCSLSSVSLRFKY